MSEGFFYSLEGPLDSMPVGRQIRAANLSGFGELVRRRGLDPRAILERHAIQPRVLRDPDAFLDSRALVELLQDCSRTFNDPMFGLRMAQLQEPEVFGAIATLCRAAANFREALESFIDFIPVLHCPGVVLELHEAAGMVELRWQLRTDPGVADQATYKGALLTLKLLRQLGGPAFQASHVSLPVDARAEDLPEISRIFGCEFRPRAPVGLVAFSAAVMERPLANANRLLFRLLGGYLERVRSASRQSPVERVEDYVRGVLSSGNCSIEHCARKLGIPVRTLQSSLSQQGLRFSDIVERQRRELALSSLQRDELALEDVAALLGYSEQSSFGRAFKRWTGSTPQCYRRDLELHRAA